MKTCETCGKPEGSCQSERAAGRSGGAHEAAASGEPPQESVGAREGCKQARQAQLTALPWRLGRGFDSGGSAPCKWTDTCCGRRTGLAGPHRSRTRTLWEGPTLRSVVTSPARPLELIYQRPPAANPEQSFIRTGYSEQQEGSTAVLMAERALGDAQGRHAIARMPRARIGQLSTWSLGCGFDSAGEAPECPCRTACRPHAVA